MEADSLLLILQQALKQKNISISTYKKYIEISETHSIRHLLEKTLEKERTHRDLLRHIQGSIRDGTYAAEQVKPDLTANSGVIGGQFNENLNLLVQSNLVANPQNSISNTKGSIGDIPRKRWAFSCELRTK